MGALAAGAIAADAWSFVLPHRGFAREEVNGRNDSCNRGRRSWINRGQRPGYNLSAFARLIAPNREADKQKIDNHKGRDIALPADAKPITVQSFPENKVHTV